MPASIQAVLAARIDRLPPDEKRILNCAAVIGRRVPYELLAEIAETQPQASRACRRESARGRIPLRDAPLSDARIRLQARADARGRLHHPAAGTPSPAARADLSRPRNAADDSSDRAEQLANHAFRAELWAKAIIHLRRAAGVAIARSADADAIQYLDQAITALSHLPDEPATLERRSTYGSNCATR